MSTNKIEPLIVLGIKDAGDAKIDAALVKSNLTIETTIRVLKQATAHFKKELYNLPF